MTAPIKPISALDVPVPQLLAAVGQLACTRVLMKALEQTHSPSDRIAYALDLELISSGARVACDADYPQWAAELASRPTYYRAKETT